MRKGKLIVIDGTDGSGKKTQIDLLHKKLEKEGYKIEKVDFPRYYTSFYGKMVGRYLTGEFGDTYETSPYLTSLLYAGDRLLAKNQIEKWLNQGKIVLTNRYVPANLAHQSAKLAPKERDKFIKWLLELEYKVHKLPKEDVVIFLYVPAVTAQKLLDKKGHRDYLGGFKKDIHERNIKFLIDSENQYKKLVKRYKWYIIECTQNKKILPREAIADKIWQVVQKIIKH
ncbi:MAG: hypothetical protein NT135_03255 [Candidatus Berkelbacteria bacterium]|nr:hypothetical protein [Candidatus Berkelbacteria bacterium]